jgi:isoleucyl-tRNA synthetase
MTTRERLLRVRDEVNAALEEQRKQKVIGNSLGARVTLTASGPLADLLEEHRANLPTLFIVSDVALHLGAREGADTVTIAVEKAAGIKCERCWRYVASVRSEPEWAGLCDRCVESLGGAVHTEAVHPQRQGTSSPA